MATIDTNPASGTRDFLPRDVALRQHAFTTIREVFERYGFAPIDTPAFERLEVLLGKYGEEGDKLIFKILRRGEHEASGDADLALRYDLTVPLARFMAKYSDQLGEPFKRYHIAPVWRADRPGKGRFREFTQCDVDTAGTDSLVADAETILAITDVLAALGLDGFEVLLNSREALHGLIEAYGIPAELAESTLVALDKLDKVGPEGVARELDARGIPSGSIDTIVGHLTSDTVDDDIRGELERTDRGRAGLAEVDRVLELTAGNLAAGNVRFAPVLARGLSYYTGPIFEIQHLGLGSSIASGGRYDGLVGMFSNRDIPATGGSIGLERVLLLLEDTAAATVGPSVMVTVMDEALQADAMGLATRLRRAGIDADLYSGSGRLGKQLKHADRRGARFAVIRGSDERDAGTVAVKDLVSGDQQDVAEDDLASHLREALAAHRG